ETEKLILDAGVPSGKILTVQGRIEAEETQRNLIDETVKEFGKIDVLVNNAGAVMKANTDPESLENYDFLFNVNLRSVVALTKLAVPHLEKTRGNIVNISTVGSTRLLPHATFYACSKAALDHYTRHCALLYGSKGIRVNGINPGPVETSVYSRHNPPEDVQLAVIFVEKEH
ncbi:putative oxidoreductase, partial [Aphelenchoides avenae]